MVVVHLLVQFAAGNRHLFRIYHYHKVTNINVRTVHRLVLSPQDLGHLGSQPSQRLTGGVNHKPFVRDLILFHNVCFHSGTPSVFDGH